MVREIDGCGVEGERGHCDGEVDGVMEEGVQTRKSAATATERELMLCRRHVRQGPVWMEDDPAKAAAMHGIKAALKEDPASCYVCVARAAALNRIQMAGADSVKAAEDLETRARGDICIMKRYGKEECKIEPMKVRGSYIKELLTGSPLTPLRTLPEEYFQEPEDRVTILSSALEVLSRIDEIDNILLQFFEKGYAMMEVHVRPREELTQWFSLGFSSIEAQVKLS